MKHVKNVHHLTYLADYPTHLTVDSTQLADFTLGTTVDWNWT